MFCVILYQLLYNHYSDWLGKQLLLTQYICLSMEGNKKHKCMYCDYTSDRAGNVRIHVEKKHPKNSSTQIEVGAGKNEDQQGMGMGDQLINTMGGLKEDKHTQCGGGVEGMEDNYDSELDVTDLENAILTNWNAFKRKLEMGNKLKELWRKRRYLKYVWTRDRWKH